MDTPLVNPNHFCLILLKLIATKTHHFNWYLASHCAFLHWKKDRISVTIFAGKLSLELISIFQNIVAIIIEINNFQFNLIVAHSTFEEINNHYSFKLTSAESATTLRIDGMVYLNWEQWDKLISKKPLNGEMWRKSLCLLPKQLISLGVALKALKRKNLTSNGKILHEKKNWVKNGRWISESLLTTSEKL